MDKTIKNLLSFLGNNPGATKTAISEAIDLKGLALFNLLKKQTTEGKITEDASGEEKIYSLAAAPTAVPEPKVVRSATPKDGIEEEKGDEGTDNGAQSQTKEEQSTRDNSKFKFNGQEYGKGPLVRAVVAQFVADNPGTTYKKLKAAFPDELLKRFGIFQNVDEAKTIGGKGNRYFTKPDQIIKLKDAEVVVCNQLTAQNIQPFLKTAKALGYKIK